MIGCQECAKTTGGLCEFHQRNYFIQANANSEVNTLTLSLSAAIAERDKLAGLLEEALMCLDKIADPRLRDHREPDKYTELGCVMHMAQETTDRIRKALK